MDPDAIVSLVFWGVIIAFFLIGKLKELAENAVSGEGAQERLQRLREFRRELREGMQQAARRQAESPDTSRSGPKGQSVPLEPLSTEEAALMLAQQQAGRSLTLAERLAITERLNQEERDREDRERRDRRSIADRGDEADGEPMPVLPAAQGGIRLPPGLPPVAQAFALMEILASPRALSDYQSPDQHFVS